MRDPRFSNIHYAIESKLHEVDCLAGTRGVALTDSAVRSLLVRCINEAKGKVAKSTAASDKDRFLAEALQQLALVRASIMEEWPRSDGSVELRPLPTVDWIASLEAIKDSCSVRTGSEPGSRSYLDFLKGFIEQVSTRS